MHESHNVPVLIYHFVCPLKYGKIIFGEEDDNVLQDLCVDISKRYETLFFNYLEGRLPE